MKLRRFAYGSTAAAALVILLIWAFMPRPVLVELATATIGSFETSINEDGKTRVRERYLIAAPLSGRLARISLREGDLVAEGDIVAQLTPLMSPLLDARTLQEQSARVASAEAQLARGEARIESARVVLEGARNQLKRSEALGDRGFVATNQLDNDRLALQAARADLDVATQERHVAMHELEQARAAMLAVQVSTLSQSMQKPGAQTSAAADFSVRAPAAGRVLRLLQASATTLTLGTPLIEIGDVSSLEIMAELLTTDALQATPGTPVRIERWGGQGPLEGRVRRVEPGAFTKVSALGVEEQRVNVLIDISSPRELWQALGDGYRVSVRVITLSQEAVLRVPVSAVFPRSNGERLDDMAAFVVDSGHAHLRSVEVGARNGIEAWIKSGLQPGDQVIIYPGDAVRDGARVAARTISGNQ